MPGRKSKPINVSLTLEGIHLDTALSLIAGLIGSRDRTKEQGRFALTADMLPDAMLFERAALRAIYAMSEENLPPSRENVLARLLLDFSDADKRLGELMTHRSTPEPLVQRHAFVLGDWMERRRMLAAAIQMQAILTGNVGNAQEAYEEAARLFTAVAPRQSNITVVTAREADHLFLDHQEQAHEIIKSGRTLGPTLPWAGLQGLVPYLKAGDLACIMLRSKHGKTIMAQIIGEWIAYYTKEFTRADVENHPGEQGYNVDFLHMETDLISMQERRYSRLLRIHIQDLYKIPLKSNALTANRVREIDTFIRDAGDFGELRYISCPGITWAELMLKMEQGKARAESMGRQYVVIMDYFQKMDWSHWHPNDETKGLNTMAHKLKAAIQGMGIYGIVFAQLDINAAKNKRTSFGGQAIQQASQTSIKVSRFGGEDGTGYDAQDSKPWTIDGKQMVDAFGGRIWKHQEGQVGSDAEFDVIFQNQPGTMGKSPCYFINGFFDIRDSYDDEHWLKSRNGNGGSNPF